jgi:hypothetical protein
VENAAINKNYLHQNTSVQKIFAKNVTALNVKIAVNTDVTIYKQLHRVSEHSGGGIGRCNHGKI